MNKTVNINIGGLIFHIDEDAYQKLTRYFDAIKRSLSNSSGKDEIMKDIEMRVAELLIEKQKSDKHVINNKDVDEVIVVMGQPEDYRIDDENDSASDTKEPYYPYTKPKKLYRDKDRGTIAGVCTGLGHYFGIDAVWLKILFFFSSPSWIKSPHCPVPRLLEAVHTQIMSVVLNEVATVVMVVVVVAVYRTS